MRRAPCTNAAPPPPARHPPRSSTRRRRRVQLHAARGPADTTGPGDDERAAPPAPLSPTAPSIDAQIFALAVPTLAALAADPLAGLVSTGFVGRLGAGPLASTGVALSVFNSSTKLLNMPLLAVTTSSVAQALGADAADGSAGDAQQQLSRAVSAAVVLAVATGACQTAALLAFGGRGLALWGAAPGGLLHGDAAAYLAVRALAAPATALMLVVQGCFRGLGDARTTFLASLASNALNIALEPLLIFRLGWGVRGAAAAVGLSQAAACLGLLALLRRRGALRGVGVAALRRSLGFLGSTGLLALRTLGVMSAYSLATSLAARAGPAHAAAHQVAFQVWLASSLLADSLAVAAQALLARSVAAGQLDASWAVVARTLQMAAALGVALAAALALGSGAIARAFTSDPAVLAALSAVWGAVVATQPLNALAFAMDGILYGCGGFGYAARAMAAAALPACGVMLAASHAAAAAALAPTAAADAQLAAAWAGLGVLMLARFATLFVPLLRRSGPFAQLA